MGDLGFRLIVLSGGEPTLRKDWDRIGYEINSEGMRFGIISNALAWNSETIDRFKPLDCYAIGFSVDGERETHDYIREIQGSHKKVFESIKNIKRIDKPVCTITTINSRNLPELPTIRNRLRVYGVDA